MTFVTIILRDILSLSWFIDQTKITNRNIDAGSVETNDNVSVERTSWKDAFKDELTTKERKAEETKSGNFLLYARLEHIEERQYLYCMVFSWVYWLQLRKRNWYLILLSLMHGNDVWNLFHNITWLDTIEEFSLHEIIFQGCWFAWFCMKIRQWQHV